MKKDFSKEIEGVFPYRADSYKIPMIQSGLEDLDNIIGGFRAGSFYLLGSVGGMGKSGFCLTMANQICINRGIPTLYISTDTEEKLVNELLANISEVELCKIGDEDLSYHEKVRMDEGIEALNESTFKIFDVEQYLYFKEAINYRLKDAVEYIRSENIGAIIIDDIERLCDKEGDNSSENYNKSLRFLENIKFLALSLEVPIIATSTLARSVNSRIGYRPRLEDFAMPGCTSIADCIFGLLRRDYYDPLDKPGMAEVIISKNSHGNIGTINLILRKELKQFVSYRPLTWATDPDLINEENGINPFAIFQEDDKPIKNDKKSKNSWKEPEIATQEIKDDPNKEISRKQPKRPEPKRKLRRI